MKRKDDVEIKKEIINMKKARFKSSGNQESDAAHFNFDEASPSEQYIQVTQTDIEIVPEDEAFNSEERLSTCEKSYSKVFENDNVIQDLAQWAVKFQVTNECANELLHLLYRYHPHLPKDIRTVKKSLKSVTGVEAIDDIKDIESSVIMSKKDSCDCSKILESQTNTMLETVLNELKNLRQEERELNESSNKSVYEEPSVMLKLPKKNKEDFLELEENLGADRSLVMYLSI